MLSTAQSVHTETNNGDKMFSNSGTAKGGPGQVQAGQVLFTAFLNVSCDCSKIDILTTIKQSSNLLMKQSAFRLCLTKSGYKTV